MMKRVGNLQPVVECIGLVKVFQDFWGRDKVLAVDNLLGLPHAVE